MPVNPDAASRFVRSAYMTLLGREPDPAGLRMYSELILSDENKLAAVLDSISKSEEYRKKHQQQTPSHLTDYNIAVDGNINKHRNEEVDAASAAIRGAARRDLEKFKDFVAKSTDPAEWGMGRYYAEHEIRFLEIVNSFACLFPRSEWSKCDILDVGGSIFTKIFSLMVRPHAIDLLDRWIAPTLKDFVRDCYTVDLAEPIDFPKYNISARYNFIVFTEVLEHLLANPKRVIGFLGSLLKEGGYLYITTPNFFSKHKLAMMRNRANPQPIYSEKYNKADAPHFHVREYCMSELLQICEDAGLHVHAFMFSDCWESNVPLEHKRKAEELGNLLVVARR